MVGTMDMEPETVTERVGLVVAELYNGEELTTREIATLLGLTRGAAWLMMVRLCRVLPLVQIDKRWQKMKVDRN